MKRLHLICNAHIDPVWLWDTEEGISAALSTFRQAALFCEEQDGFVFNHNEALLYEWIEELDPPLFSRIQALVKAGKWHIMGGWYLQPDCNMPSGESIIRQMEYGRRYFKEKFEKEPKTAINFDPFGHSRGLVQLLVKAGYTSYLFCRPGQGDCALEADSFLWKGFDGSVIAARREGSYGTQMGKAGKKLTEWLEENGRERAPERYEKEKAGILLWGVGNHGGGPSAKDLKDLAELVPQAKKKGWEMIHSIPEDYFAEWEKDGDLFVYENELNHWAVGCYTSQIRIKQKHRRLEQELFMVEKMITQALAGNEDEKQENAVLKKEQQERMEADLKEAWKALLFCEFHDVLPGSSIRAVEEESIRKLEYGLNLVLRWKRTLFFKMLAQEKKAEPGEYPIFVYNPHPFAVETDIVCEFQLADQNWSDQFAQVCIRQGDTILPSQLEKEGCNMNLDWRKKVVFHAALKPSSMNRFYASIQMVKQPQQKADLLGDRFVFDNGHLHVEIDPKTGLPAVWTLDGREIVRAGGCKLTVMKSDCDPWGMNRHSYRDKLGEFTLLEKKEGSRYSGTLNERHAGEKKEIESVRVIENGSVRTVVEAVFGFEQSRACLRYTFSQKKNAVDLHLQVDWAQKGCMLKLEIPAALEPSIEYKTETMYGVQEANGDGEEKVFQRWCAAMDKQHALTVINSGTYGGDFKDGVIRISLIHSAVYSAHPIGDRPLLRQDRMLDYIDQGEREFSFRIEGGSRETCLRQIAQEAEVYGQAPMAVQAFPGNPKEDRKLLHRIPAITLDNPAVMLGAAKKLEKENAYLIRLFESTGQVQTVRVNLVRAGIETTIELNPFEVRTLKYIPQEKSLFECGIFG